MNIKTNKVKFLFWRNWTLLNAAFFVIGYIVVIIYSILLMTAFDLPWDEWGSPVQQTMWKIGEGAILGFSLGIIQWRMLRREFRVSSFWLYSVPVGIILTELIAGMVLLKLDINRGECAFWENYPLFHALIAASYGLIIGLIQLPFIRKYFSGGAFWIIANTLAWGASILVTAIKVSNDIFLLVAFILGILLYGAITGATFIWILHPRETNS